MSYLLKLVALLATRSDYARKLILVAAKRLSPEHLRELIGVFQDLLATFAPAEAPAAAAVETVVEQVYDKSVEAATNYPSTLPFPKK